MIKILRSIIFLFFFVAVLEFLSMPAYATSCAPPVSGDYTVSASCTFANTVDGVDSGSGTTNTAVLTIANGQTLTVGNVSNQTIGYGSITLNGTLIINKGVGASLTKAPIWMVDADADGYPSSTTQTVSATAPASSRRRNLLTSISSTDCLDSNANVFQNVTNLVTDADNDGFSPTPGTVGSQCVGALSTINSRNYYKDSAGSYTYLDAGSLLPAVGTNGDIGTFSTTSQGQLPQVDAVHDVFSLTIGGTNYAYVLGGYTGSVYLSTVYKATIDSSANIGTFSTTSQTQLPQNLNGLAADTVTIGGTNYVYVLGGYNGTTVYSTVYKATIDSSGNIGAFSTTSQGQLPLTLRRHAAVIATVGGTNYVYSLGGIVSGSTVTAKTAKATIDSSGNIGAFSTTGQGTLPHAVHSLSANTVTIGGTNYIYALGGYDGSIYVYDTVAKATIDSSGNIGAFSSTSQGQLPQALYMQSSNIVTTGGTNYIYVMGGFNGTNYSAVYKATIDSSGNIGAFSSTSQGQLPQATSAHRAFTASIGGTNYIYSLGGYNGTSTYYSTVYKAKISVSTNVDCNDGNAAVYPGAGC